MSRQSTTLYERRAFLNKRGHNSVAAIFASLEDDSSVNLIISDCSHTVQFDVSVYDKVDRRNTIHKLGVMIEVLREFRDAVVQYGLSK